MSTNNINVVFIPDYIKGGLDRFEIDLGDFIVSVKNNDGSLINLEDEISTNNKKILNSISKSDLLNGTVLNGLAHNKLFNIPNELMSEYKRASLYYLMYYSINFDFDKNKEEILKYYEDVENTTSNSYEFINENGTVFVIVKSGFSKIINFDLEDRFDFIKELNYFLFNHYSEEVIRSSIYFKSLLK